MTTDQINDHLEVVLMKAGVNPVLITDQARFVADLDLDSLDVTDLLIQVETYFGLRIPDEDWWHLQTVGQLKNYLWRETFGALPEAATTPVDPKLVLFQQLPANS